MNMPQEIEPDKNLMGTEMSRRKWYQVNWETLPAKLCYIFFHSKEAAYMFYINLYLTDIGFNKQQAGLISGLRLLGGLFGAPLWGYTADRYKKHRTIVYFLCIVPLFMTCFQPVLAVMFSKPCESSAFITMNLTLEERTKNNFTFTAQHLCNKDSMFYIVNGNLSFYVILLLNIAISFFDSSIIGFIDCAVLIHCSKSKHESKFNRQRMFGVFGFVFGTYITGFFIDIFPSTKVSRYSGFCISYGLNMVLFCVCTHFLLRGIKYQKDKSTVTKQSLKTKALLIKALSKPKMILFLLSITFLGFQQALFVSFSFMFLKNLNASNTMMSTFVSLSMLFAFIGYYTANKVIKICKDTWLMISLCCLFYFLRYVLFLFITKPWLLLSTSVFQSGHALFVVSFITHLKETCNVEILTSMCSVAQTCYGVLALIIANIFGGIVYNNYSGTFLFTAASIFAAVWGCFILAYRTYLHWYIRKDNHHQSKNIKHDDTNANLLVDKQIT